jgi:hypothetical protein
MAKQEDENYWQARYRAGGTSGEGSIGQLREWKWQVIEHYAGNIDDVIDVGCGDLSFWENRSCEKYTGIDISGYIIEKNRIARLDWNFIQANSAEYQPIHAKVVFCFDHLFHIIDEETFVGILNNLARYSDEWIFVYTWNRNPFEPLPVRSSIFFKMILKGKFRDACRFLFSDHSSDYSYQKYRDFLSYLPIFEEQNFALVEEEKLDSESIGSMYVLKKNTKEKELP